jgi:uncharacterized membrane protein
MEKQSCAEKAGAFPHPASEGAGAERMSEIIQQHLVQAVLFLAILGGLTVLAFHLLGRWRDSAEEEQPTASEMLTKFRELHARGTLSDEEFRTIKAKLATQLERELSDNDDTG